MSTKVPSAYAQFIHLQLIALSKTQGKTGCNGYRHKLCMTTYQISPRTIVYTVVRKRLYLSNYKVAVDNEICLSDIVLINPNVITIDAINVQN